MRASALALAALAACIPSHAAYLPLPRDAWADVHVGASPDDVAHADVALDYLAARMAPFDRSRLRFYGVGREPLQHRLVDSDGDGRLDRARVELPAGELPARLTAVCPAR